MLNIMDESGLAGLWFTKRANGRVKQVTIAADQISRIPMEAGLHGALRVDVAICLNGAEAKSCPKPRADELSRFNAKKVQAFMREHVARKLTVADLAEICDLSPSHFISAFTGTFGQAPYGYLLNMRLAHAERLLAERDMPIAEVAYLSGFSSQSHLTTAMKKIKGATPSAIRRCRK